MKTLVRSILLVSLLMISALPATAQRTRYIIPSIEKLIKNPIDTIFAQDGSQRKVVLFSNGTWKFTEDELVSRLDSCEFINTHWDTTTLFCWKDVALTDLPTLIDLQLIDSLPEYHYPVTGCVYSKYGMRRRHVHNGVDISPLKVGEALYSTFEGKVRYAKYNSGGYGYLVIVRHPNGLESWYGHLCKLACRAGDYVSAGQIIGYSGNTGRSRGPHLHFEFRYKDQTFDPEFIIDFETGALKFQNFQLERKFFNIHSRANELLEEDDYEESPQKELENADNPILVEEANEPVYHVVKSGDTLGHIAAKYGTTVSRLCELNHISKTTILQLKQHIRVR